MPKDFEDAFNDNIDFDKANFEMVKQLMARARENKHSKFELITHISEYQAAFTCKSAVKKVATKFKKITNDIYKDYLKHVKNNGSDPQLLISVKEMERVAKFYKEEAKILSEMIKEYNLYIWYGGHFIKSLFGEVRAAEDLWDFRDKQLRKINASKQSTNSSI